MGHHREGSCVDDAPLRSESVALRDPRGASHAVPLDQDGRDEGLHRPQERPVGEPRCRAGRGLPGWRVELVADQRTPPPVQAQREGRNGAQGVPVSRAGVGRAWYRLGRRRHQRLHSVIESGGPGLPTRGRSSLGRILHARSDGFHAAQNGASPVSSQARRSACLAASARASSQARTSAALRAAIPAVVMCSSQRHARAT